MPVEKSALAVVRHEVFPDVHMFFDGNIRYIRFRQLWQSHRRFRNEYTLETFHQTLEAAIRRNGAEMFVFYLPESPPTDYDQLWVAAPNSS